MHLGARTIQPIRLVVCGSALLLMLRLLVACIGQTSPDITGGPQVWVEQALRRVGQQDAPSGMATARISAARGEYEAFQVVIRAPSTGLTNTTLRLSALSDPLHAVIGAQNIQLYREQYVYVGQSSPDTGGTNRPLGAGWYADALIPAVDPVTGAAPRPASLTAFPFNLVAATNQPIWVEVFVPYGTAPGDYSAIFTVSSDQGSTTGAFQLKVWDFDLPSRPALQTSFGIWMDASSQATAQELLHNKIMPRDMLASRIQLANTSELTSVNLGFWSGANVSNCGMSPPPSVEDIRRRVVVLGPNLLIYNYTADEIGDCTKSYSTLQQWAQNLHRAGIPNLVTMAPTPALYDDGLGSGRSVVDIWAMLPEMYNAAGVHVNEVLQKGDALWSYNSLVQDNYSPKWQIDFAPLNFRIQPGFMSKSLGLTGLLYWRVDLWTSNPWNDVRTFNNGDRWFYGDGMIVYPGEQVGVSSSVASIRLKWLRDGVEDYDYLHILTQLGYGAQALALSRQAATDWHTWTRDPQVIEQTREQLATLIMRAGRVKVYLPVVRRR